MPKTVKCNECGAEISGSAKACPKCGAKVKKPLYKRPWFIILMVILVLGVIGSTAGGSSSQPSSNTVSAASSTSAPPRSHLNSGADRISDLYSRPNDE